MTRRGHPCAPPALRPPSIVAAPRMSLNTNKGDDVLRPLAVFPAAVCRPGNGLWADLQEPDTDVNARRTTNRHDEEGMDESSGGLPVGYKPAQIETDRREHSGPSDRLRSSDQPRSVITRPPPSHASLHNCWQVEDEGPNGNYLNPTFSSPRAVGGEFLSPTSFPPAVVGVCLD